MSAGRDPAVERAVALLTPEQLWQQALDQLRLLVPETTFQALFAETTGHPHNGGLAVRVPNPQSLAWIEARLTTPVQDALQAVGYTDEVTFQVAPPEESSAAQLTAAALAEPAPEPDPTSLPTPGPATLKPGDVAFTFLNFNLYARGWLRTPTYYELFWQPVLGYVAYSYWRLMQVLYWNSPSDRHTRRARLDIQDSAASLGVSRDLVRGKPTQGLGGALETLQNYGLADVERHAAGRATVYSSRFRRTLPLLTPAQVAGLTQTQQEEHLDWLLAAGYDPTLWETLGARFTTFVRDDEAPPEADPVALQAYLSPAWESDHLSRLGYLRTPAYYDLFLQPLIGPVAYAIWRACKCLNRPEAGQIYTRDTVTSVYALAATLSCHRQQITGVKRRRDGIPYWQEGAFDRLRQERLALIREEGEGSQVAYRLLVVSEPPLLCPSQVEKFPRKLREAHNEWLNRAQLQLAEWEQLSMDSLLAVLE
jgi:hypothetical protein